MTPEVTIKFKVKRSKDKITARHNVCKKIGKLSIIQPDGDFSIWLKFHPDFNHVTLDVPRTFKVIRSEV